MSLAEKQAQLIADLNLIEDPQERLAALSSYVAAVHLPESERDASLLVPGCVSRVWLHRDLVDSRARLRCAADSPMVAGLAALLCHLYDGETPAEIAVVEPELWHKCGFERRLSPTRLNGLASMRAQLRDWALRQIPLAAGPQ